MAHQPELYTYRVLDVLRAIDGDTTDCVISVGFGVRLTFRFRVAGVDTPERGEPGWAEAKTFTAVWLVDRLGRLYVSTAKSSQATVGLGDGSFGRWLGDFHADGEHLSDALRAAGFTA